MKMYYLIESTDVMSKDLAEIMNFLKSRKKTLAGDTMAANDATKPTAWKHGYWGKVRPLQLLPNPFS